MKIGLIFVVLAFFSGISQASEMAAQCASLQMQLKQLGGEKVLRDMGLGSIIDDCKKEDTESYKKKAASGTLYCSSGDLCAKYDFSNPSDRNIYLASCSQVASCPGNFRDKCTTNNDKVRGGSGTVDWTIYSYGQEMPENAKTGNCR